MSYFIYKYLNKINQKTYVGQTNNYHNRYRAHKSAALNHNSSEYDYPLHAAIRKYGLDNFDFVILETLPDDTNQDIVDERECYYITQYQSLVSQHGYNISQGGQGYRPEPRSYEQILEDSRLFSAAEIQDIQARLINDEEFADIEQLYAPRLKHSFLLNINIGYNFKDPKLSYPLKKFSKSRLTQQEIREIKERIKSGEIYRTIRNDYGINSDGFISGINSGRYFYDENEIYPLCAKKCNKRTPKAWVEGIIDDLLHSNLSQKDISVKWDKSTSTVYKINHGYAHRHSDLTYPLRNK